MTDARKPSEHGVLEHFREHSTGEPPAHLDAFILAAAHREMPAPKPGLWQRWLQACQKPRWQVAFASLVGVALMLTLVQKPESTASYDSAPAAEPAAPVAKREMTAPPSAARSMAAPAAPMAESAAPVQSESFSAEMADEAKVSKRAAAPVDTLDKQLREVVRLQKAGQQQAADDLMAALIKRYPDEDLPERLMQLQKN